MFCLVSVFLSVFRSASDQVQSPQNVVYRAELCAVQMFLYNVPQERELLYLASTSTF